MLILVNLFMSKIGLCIQILPEVIRQNIIIIYILATISINLTSNSAICT